MRKHSRTQIQIVILAVAAAFMLIMTTQLAQAQTFIKLHDFSGPEGKLPVGTLTVDATGNLYGTTTSGGSNENGTVFKLTNTGSGWVLNTLYRFAGGTDGSGPGSGVTRASDGSLYGTTSEGGAGGACYQSGCGTVFHLTPPPAGARPASLAPWNETVLYRFTGGDDGSVPYGKVIFGPDGSLYGTTTGYPDGRPGSTPQRHSDPDSSYCNSGFGGNCGNVYKLTPSGGGWAESVLYSFRGYAGSGDGAHPYSEVIFDPAGNLYGTTDGAYDGESTVYKLTPSGSGWTENILCNLLGDPTYSEFPEAGLIADSSGNLYGATSSGGVNGGGSPFKFTPGAGCNSFGYWFYEAGPYDSLTMDAAGNFYGTEQYGGTGNGDVFELRWNGLYYDYIVLHYFSYDGPDGYYPLSGLVFGPDGNLYGATFQGGNYGWGVIFEIRLTS